MYRAPESLPGISWETDTAAEGGDTTLHLRATTAHGAPAAAARLSLVRAPNRAILGVKVEKPYRRRAIGSAVLRWAEAAARHHFRAAIAAGEETMLRVDTEFEADAQVVRFLARRGLALAVAEDEMRISTSTPLSPALPAGLVVQPWTGETAPRFYEVYRDAFSTRPGSPGWDFERWRTQYTGGGDFRPDLSLLVSGGARPVAYAVCWIEGETGWVVQMGVAQAARRRGLGTALLAAVLQRFRDVGIEEVALEVATNNPEARALYEKLGFVKTLTYQSYRKRLT